MRAQFVLSEILIGLRRNLTMTLAVIVTVAVSLALFGTGLLVRQQVNTMKGFWYDKVEVSIFLVDNVTQEQRNSIRRDLEALPEVKTVFYESKEDAFERFKKQFEGNPELIDNASADSLPESFRVKLKDPDKFDVIESAFAGRPGIDSVLNQRKLLENFFTVLNKLQGGALLIAIIQLVAAAVLIANTIRVAAFNRRRETGIMRLVGASNLYIQLPFLLEGALAGFVGAALAVVALVALKHFYINDIREGFKFAPFIGWEAIWGITPWLFLTGVVLSALASFVTLRRYLRV